MVEIKEIAGESSSAGNEANQNDEMVEHNANGEAPVEHQVPVENPAQPSRLESFFAITKSLLVRALIFYLITSFFRGRSSAPEPTQGGVAAPVKLPAFNYFENGSLMVNEADEF